MIFDRLRIGARIGLGFALVLTLVAVATLTGAWRLGDVSTNTGYMMAVPLAKERLAGEWLRNISSGVQPTTALARSSDAGLPAVFADEIKATSARTDELLKALGGLANDEEKAMLAKSGDLRTAFLAARQQVLDAKTAGKTEDSERLYTSQFKPAANAYIATVHAFLERQSKAVDVIGASIQADAASGRNLLLGLCGVILVIGGVLTMTLSRSITVPIARAAALARAVAAGDVSQAIEVEGVDESAQLLRALASMQDSIAQLVSQVHSNANSIGASSAEIAAASSNLSTRTEQAAGALQQTASAIEQITAAVNHTADSARTSNQLVASASEVAHRGGTVISQVVSTMTEINDSSRKIADIIGTIDGIAFQTNILALNAAVEAARAGEQGRGFAVVASEVRSLAQRSAAAAREIKSLISSSVERVESGTRLVGDAGTTMNEIVASVKRVADIIAEVTAAAGEQSQGIGQVNTAVANLDNMTQQNAALAEESTAAAESLKGQAERLSALAASFKVNHGSASRAAAAATLAVITKASTAPRIQTPAPHPAPAPKVALKVAPKVATGTAAGADNGWGSF